MQTVFCSYNATELLSAIFDVLIIEQKRYFRDGLLRGVLVWIYGSCQTKPLEASGVQRLVKATVGQQ